MTVLWSGIIRNHLIFPYCTGIIFLFFSNYLFFPKMFFFSTFLKIWILCRLQRGLHPPYPGYDAQVKIITIIIIIPDCMGIVFLFFSKLSIFFSFFKNENHISILPQTAAWATHRVCWTRCASVLTPATPWLSWGGARNTGPSPSGRLSAWPRWGGLRVSRLFILREVFFLIF